MAKVLDGKVAIVTGSGSGIGREVAAALVREGARVVVSDLSEEAGKETVKIIGEEHAFFQQTDVADPDSVRRLVNATVERYGRLDIAHNNAGIPGQIGPLLNITQDDWNRVVAVNLTGVFNCLQAELKVMIDSGGGTIINTASVLGYGALPDQAHYIATKHGVLGLTKSAAIEYATKGIRVNAVVPGPVQTPFVEALNREKPGYFDNLASFIPAKRLVLPSDVAKAVVWLASDESSFVNGAPIIVDGGLLAHV